MRTLLFAIASLVALNLHAECRMLPFANSASSNKMWICDTYGEAPNATSGDVILNLADGKIYKGGASSWSSINDSTPVIPFGLITFVSSGTCPSGWTQVTALNGVTLRGTVAANNDVGGTGGSDMVTPSGSVTASIFTGTSATSSAVSAGTPSGTNATSTVTPLGSLSADSAGTPAGTNGTGAVSGTSAAEATHTHAAGAISWPGGVPTNASGAFSEGAISWPAGVPTNAAITAGTPAGTISALTTGADSSTTGGVAKAVAQTPTFAGSALATHTHTISWPAGVPTIALGIFTQPTVSWPAGVPTGAVTGAGSSHSHGAGTFIASAEVFTGNLLATHTHTFTGGSSVVAAQVFSGAPLGTHTHTLVATGNNSVPLFTGASLDVRNSFVKVIFCSKN